MEITFNTPALLFPAISLLLLAYLFEVPILYGSSFIPPAALTSLGFVALGFNLIGLALPHIRLMSYTKETSVRSGYAYALIFFLLMAGIVTIGYRSYHNFEEQFRSQMERQISTIAKLKADELVNWRKERLGDAEFLQDNPAFSALVERYFEDPNDVEAREQLVIWMKNYTVYAQYSSVRLLDAIGTEKLSVPKASDKVDARLIMDATISMSARKIVFSDFQRDTDSVGEIHISILIPIYSNQNRERSLGVLALRIDPKTFLYPSIESWPALSTTAETLLVRRDGEDVLYLNELRFKPDAALGLRYPLTNTEIPAVKAVLGQTGMVEGLDYRGEQVLADVRSIPDTPWFLVTKIDTDEIYAPLRTRLWEIFGMISATIFVAGAGLALIWRQQRILFYRTQAEAAIALRESDERFKSAFEYSAIGMALISPQGKWLKINPKVCEIIGYSEGELLVKTIQDITHPDDLSADLDQVRQMLTGEIESYTLEKRYFHKNGHIVWVLLAASLVKGVDGAPLYFISQIEDITLRKQAEESLRKSESLYRRAIEVAGAVPYLQSYSTVGTGVHYDFIGEGILDITGYERGEFNEKVWDSLIQESFLLDDLAEYSWKEAIRRVRSGEGSLWKCEHRIRARDGEMHWVFEAAIELRDENGVSNGSIGLFQDITARKQADEALRESEERYRTVVSNAPVVIFVTDENGIFTLSEGKGLVKLGLQPGQVVGLSLFDVYKDYPAILDAMKSALAGNSLRREIEVQGIVFDVFFSPVFDAQGNVIKVIGVSNDVSERKQAENEIRQLNQLLEQRVVERTAQLQAANKELEAFSYSVSHDLRAPLRGIDGWSQALLEDYHDKFDEQGQQYINRVRSETQRMGQLIDDMLKLSRLTRAEMAKERVDLSILAENILERLKRDEPERKVDFSIQEGLTVEGDSHLLEAALTNLLGNAFKFTARRADARIELGEIELESQRVFFIRDNGVGFDMTYSQKLFGAFQRMHKVSEFPGTGIGLATVQRVIHRHGGRVWAEAEVDNGATFYFTLV